MARKTISPERSQGSTLGDVSVRVDRPKLASRVSGDEDFVLGIEDADGSKRESVKFHACSSVERRLGHAMNGASLNGEVNDRLLGDAPEITSRIDCDVGHRRALPAPANAIEVSNHDGSGDARCRVDP